MIYGKLSQLKNDEIKTLLHRSGEISNVNDVVSSIVKDVSIDGDTALRMYTNKFDGAVIDNIEVSKEEIEVAYETIDKNLIHHLEIAASNIHKFHEAQMPDKQWFIEVFPGIEVGQKFTPFDTVGAYVPGGRASYPSSALMTIIPPKVAGVKKVIMCTPPNHDGTVNPLTLVAAKIAGVDHIYKIGGVQAVASMAYGTESVLKVDKIVGPGNVYVTAAKMQVRDLVEIDFPAGPSEILIIADDTGNPIIIASDMIAQAEHDPQALSVLVTTSELLASKVKSEILNQSKNVLRKEIVYSSLKHAAIIITDSIDECIDFSNKFAPEHLEIMTNNNDEILKQISHAGSIFLGEFSPVSVGDYASGTNHVLPTAGYAKLHSGLNVLHFFKVVSIQRLSKKGLNSIKDTVITLAEKEGLQAHADAVKIRFRDI